TSADAQAPGAGWLMSPSDRVTRTLYWDLFKQTEVWTQITPQPRDAPGKRVPASLVFWAVFNGRRPASADIDAAPAPIMLLAQAGPLAWFPNMSLKVGGVDLGSDPAAKYQYPPNCERCSANGVQVPVPADMLKTWLSSPTISGEMLGIPFVFVREDVEAL